MENKEKVGLEVFENSGDVFVDFEEKKWVTIEDFTRPSEEFVEFIESSNFKLDSIVTDMKYYQKYAYLVYKTLWEPLCERGVQYFFAAKDSYNYPYELLTPLDYMGIWEAREFWFKKNDNKFDVDGDIFAYARNGSLNVRAIFTIKGVYVVKKKLFRKAELELIPWENAKFRCEHEEEISIKVFVNDNKIIDYDDEWGNVFSKDSEKIVNEVLAEFPRRVQSALKELE